MIIKKNEAALSISQKNQSRFFHVFALVLALSIISCKKDDFIVPNKILSINFNDEVSKIETLGHYSLADAVVFLQRAKISKETKTTSGFDLYRVTYKTTNFDGRIIPVSGLLAIPDSKKMKGIMSYQHGTNPFREYAPSLPSADEGIGIASVFAGNEYMVLIPDYIGLGVSKEIPTYLHSKTTVNAVVDFAKIGARIFKELTSANDVNLYLTGFSQGGGATAAVQRELEIKNTTGLRLKAAAGVAGAYNLKNISIKYALTNKSVLYLGYLANSYANIYKQNLSSIIQPKYLNIIPSLFDGSKDVDYIIASLPIEPEKLYTQSVIEAIKTNKSNWFTDALQENETYMWKPISKLRLYYGAEDTDVSPEDSKAAYNYIKKLNGNIELVNIGNYDHTGSLINSLPEIQNWFNNSK